MGSEYATLGAMRDCLVEIEHLSATGRGDRRPDILRRVTDLFLITADQQKPADTEVFSDVLQRLAHGVDADARLELARRLADSPKAPKLLIRDLAYDAIEIARPILERSPRLSDTDLIELACSGDLARSDAISRRARLNAAVTEILAEHGDDIALMQMVANAEAAFKPATFELLTERAKSNSELRQMLLLRHDLPAAFAARLREQEAPPQQETEEAHGHAFSERSLEHTERARPLNGRDTTPPVSTAQTGIDHDDDNGDEGDYSRPQDEPEPKPTRRQDEAQLAELARAGRLEETIACLSHLTGFAPPLVRNCLLSAEAPALVILCKAHFLSSPTFSALLQLRQTAGAISPKGIASAMRRYETMDPYMAQRIMRFLRVRLAQPGAA